MPPTRIKFCGLTRPQDIRLAVELRVDFIGLVLAARSPRRLQAGQARALRALVPEGIGAVALVMDNPRDEVADIVSELRPDYLQFHGGEDDAFCAGFGLPFFKAIAMGDGDDPLQAMARFPSAHGFVLDGHAAGEPGGSGRGFDWARLPETSAKPVLLAGGLSPDNAAQAVRDAHPWGVDVSSGIEAAPGVKDPVRMQRFADAVRAADAR